jgi:hypothetical protein
MPLMTLLRRALSETLDVCVEVSLRFSFQLWEYPSCNVYVSKVATGPVSTDSDVGTRTGTKKNV